MESCRCYDTEFEFRSLMARGMKLLLSLSVFAIMLQKRLPDGSKMKIGLKYYAYSFYSCFEYHIIFKFIHFIHISNTKP